MTGKPEVTVETTITLKTAVTFGLKRMRRRCRQTAGSSLRSE
jgi:hypothetical protein